MAMTLVKPASACGGDKGSDERRGGAFG